jgi:amino acid transporter
METSNQTTLNSELKRDSIRTLGIVVIVLAVSSPLIGLTGTVPSAMITGNGDAAPAAFLLVGLCLLLFSVGFMAMSRYVTHAGAMYAYVGRGLNVQFGLGAGMLGIWCYTAFQVAVYAFFGSVSTSTIEGWWHVKIPWEIATLFLILLVQVFGYLKIEIGARVLMLLMACEWSIMILLGIVIMLGGGAHHGFAFSEVWAPSHMVGGGAVIAIMWAMASMSGFENAASYGEEVKSPKKSVGRAAYISILMITGFFVFTSWMLIVGYGPSQALTAAGSALQAANPAQYVFNAGDHYLGGWSSAVMSIFVLTSMFACALAFHNGIIRYQYTMARDGILPKTLTRINRHGSPYVSSLVQGVTVIIVFGLFLARGSNPVTVIFFWTSGIGVVSCLMLYFLIAIAIVRFFRRNPQSGLRKWESLWAPGLSIVVMALLFVAVIDNFALLIGTSQGLAIAIATSSVLPFLAGIALFGLRRNYLSKSALQDLKEVVG